MATTPEFIWSNTDFPYMCLKDNYRTLKFKEAIGKVTNKDSIVIDVGSGSGIMSLFASDFGAKEVYSVEIDHMLAESLKKTVKANNKQDVIRVIEGDIFKVELPKNVDVVIAEIIDTGMLDELQVPAMNDLRTRGVIGDNTIVLPSAYKTYVELINTNSQYYGYKIYGPKHEWPFYTNTQDWVQNKFTAVSEKVEVCTLDFMNGMLEQTVSVDVKFHLSEVANAVRISGKITLADGIEIGPTNALNGDKILNIDDIDAPEVNVRISYEMSKGLGNFNITRI